MHTMFTFKQVTVHRVQRGTFILRLLTRRYYVVFYPKDKAKRAI